MTDLKKDHGFFIFGLFYFVFNDFIVVSKTLVAHS